MTAAKPRYPTTQTLTAKQRRFVEEYLIDLNATQAATRAGYSEATAYAIGHECLKKPKVAAAVQRGQAVRSGEVRVTSDDVLRELWLIATTSTSDRTRVAALAWVGKHLGMFTHNIRVSQELPFIRVIYTEEDVERSA
jgi:hypothetical protein